LIPADRGPGLRQGADVLGAVLITGALMVTVYTVVTPGGSLPLALLALGLGVAFVVREATAPAPLVPLRIFRQGETARANLAQLLSAAGMFGMFFVGYNILHILLSHFTLLIFPYIFLNILPSLSLLNSPFHYHFIYFILITILLFLYTISYITLISINLFI
jgi:hypothetical protein